MPTNWVVGKALPANMRLCARYSTITAAPKTCISGRDGWCCSGDTKSGRRLGVGSFFRKRVALGPPGLPPRQVLRLVTAHTGFEFASHEHRPQLTTQDTRRTSRWYVARRCSCEQHLEYLLRMHAIATPANQSRRSATQPSRSITQSPPGLAAATSAPRSRTPARLPSLSTDGVLSVPLPSSAMLLSTRRPFP
jgi:hypothetical protein